MISKTDIKQLSRLSTKKGRNEYGLYFIEGLRIIRSALRAQAPINRIFVTARFEESVDYLSNIDEILGELINKYSQSTLTTRGDALETLMRSIVGQQISVKAAASVWQKIINLLDGIKPDNVILAGFENLKSCGLSKQKAQYILNIAEHFQSRNITDESYWQDRDYSNVYKELTSIKGVGPWTAEMFGMF